MEVSKQDWKLFREKLPGWQETYMDRLNKEYIALLAGEGTPSEFRKLCERIRQDKQSRGVMLQPGKQNMARDITTMINDGVITFDQLEGFSEELVENVQHLCSREY